MTHAKLLVAVALLSGLAFACRSAEPRFGASGGSATPRATDNGNGAAPATPTPARGASAGPQVPAPAAAPGTAGAPGQALPAGVDLMHPPEQDLRAPDRFAVELETTKGPIIIEVTRTWAPRGADRFYTLVRLGYFRQVAFFRVVQGFMAQVGIHGDPAVNRVWQNRRIPDDRPTQHNTRGMVSFATSGPDSRVNQFFINFSDNSRLDPMGFAPFGRVRDMTPVDALYSGYGEGAPAGRGPSQGRITSEGAPYLLREFPQLDYIRDARVLPDPP